MEQTVKDIDTETVKKIRALMQEIGLQMFHCSYEDQHVVDVDDVRYLPNSYAEHDGAYIEEFQEALEEWLLTTNTNEYDRSSDDRFKGEIYFSLFDHTQKTSVFTISEEA